jgi:hypothetical protein
VFIGGEYQSGEGEYGQEKECCDVVAFHD